MKTIDTKSVLLGVCATLLLITLTSGKTENTGNNLDCMYNPSTGITIFNRETKTAYSYGIGNKGIVSEPGRIFKFSNDGSQAENIK